MKFRITQKGVHDEDGKPVEVGKVLAVKGKAIPPWLENKAEEILDGRRKTPVTNPTKDARPSGDEGATG